MELNELKDITKHLLLEKGFYHVIEDKDVYQVTSLINTEVSEYTQLFKRHGFDEDHKQARAEEIADILIRTMSLAIIEGIDLHEVVRHKMEQNFKRPYRFNTKDEEVIAK